MGRRYNTFYEMLKDLSSREFLVKYYLKVKFFKNIIHIDAYQDLCRIYLDEYSEQVELREEYFCKEMAKKYNTTLSYMKWVRNKCKNCIVKAEHDTYFERRWLRRN